MKSRKSLPLFQSLPEPPPDGKTTFINSQLWFVDHDGFRVVFCHHEPIFRVSLAEPTHLRLVSVNLRLSELATQEEIAVAFGHSVATQRRWEKRFQQHGLAGLEKRTASGRPRSIPEQLHAFVRHWFQDGLSLAVIARRLAVSTNTVRRLLTRLGLQQPLPPDSQGTFIDPAPSPTIPPTLQTSPASADSPVTSVRKANEPALPATPSPATVTQPASPKTVSETTLLETSHNTLVAVEVLLATASVEPENTTPTSAVTPFPELTTQPATPNPLPPSFTMDQDPNDRSGDRLLARQGLLADALPLFGNADNIPGAGVLLAVPLLDQHAVVLTFQKVYGVALCPAFYGLRTIVVALVLWTLLRIKRPENLKEYPPRPLGQLLGLDRAPEVKTLRRKLTRLAQCHQGGRLQTELAFGRLRRQEQVLAFFYFDGHVRIYSGKEPLAKTKKAQQALARPACTDIWVHEGHGLPLLVFTTAMNAQLTQVLEELIVEVKKLLPPGVRPTALFDRGGFSPKLFRRLLAAGVDIITYRKGKRRRLPVRVFQEQEEILDGEKVSYRLHDQTRVRVGRLRSKKTKRLAGDEAEFLWLRQVTILRADGRQTQILTNRTDLSAVETAYRLFERWRQENFFKYLNEEFALDGLLEYGVEDMPAEATRPNPFWLRVKKKLKKARAEVARLQAELGTAAAGNKEQHRPTMRGFKIAQADVRKQLAAAEACVERLRKQLAKIPKRVSAQELKQLKGEKRLVVDALKMVAYEIETELFGRLGKYYERHEEEGRTLLQAAFRSSGSLAVAEGELRVKLAAQSSPHRTEALAKLCEEMNQLNRVFPGTNLRLRFTVETE